MCPDLAKCLRPRAPPPGPRTRMNDSMRNIFYRDELLEISSPSPLKPGVILGQPSGSEAESMINFP